MAGLESLLALFLSHLSRSREFLVETFIFFIIPLSNASRKRNEKKNIDIVKLNTLSCHSRNLR